ncbi:MAG: antibiotic biosynthesis monooxygenase [Acetobacteraceae bacterium]|nr:antibiotic biosynthesis monooxygenase [Acetobacteraceae bacterium]
MRFLLLSLLAVALPAAARAEAPLHDSRTGNIAFTYTGEVLPGQEEAFKQLVSKVVAAVAQEPGTMAYEWSMRADGKTFDVVEVYQDSNAVVAHVKDVGSKFGADFGKTQKTLRLVVYGDPDAEARKAIEGLHPEYETPFAGFIR